MGVSRVVTREGTLNNAKEPHLEEETVGRGVLRVRERERFSFHSFIGAACSGGAELETCTQRGARACWLIGSAGTFPHGRMTFGPVASVVEERQRDRPTERERERERGPYSCSRRMCAHWSQRSSVGNLLLKETKFDRNKEPETLVSESGELHEKKICVINSPDLLQPDLTADRLTELVSEIADACGLGPHVFVLVLQPEDFTEQHKTRLESVLESENPDLLSLSVKKVREEMRRCVSQCGPGPNVLLLLEKPSDFTQTDREKLRFILRHFYSNAFKHAMVILTHNENTNRCVDDLIGDCEGRYYSMSEQDRDQLMEIIEHIINKNESFLTFIEEKKPSLNLVVCGRTGAEKTSVVQSILGRGQFSSPGQCVKHEREVCGRWVSLVELPDLSGKPPNAVTEQCLHCLSLFGPEGVHAFILVLPVAPLTDEDKAELNIIQDCLSPQARPFSMIVFAVDSDPTAPAVVNFVRGDPDLQKLYERCGEGSFIFSTKNQQQVSELLDYAEKLSTMRGQNGFTTETLVLGQLNKCPPGQGFMNMNGVSRPRTRGAAGSSSSAPPFLSLFLTITVRRSSVHPTPMERDGFYHHMINKETVKCISMLAPGPHVFLLVIKITRFTKEEQKAIQHIKEGFGSHADQFTIVLFTHGDDLEENNKTIEKYIEKGDCHSLNQLLSECGNRYHVFNNRNKTDRSQVKELLQKIDHMVMENGGRYYTNDMLQEAEAAINKETQRLLQEKEQEMKREREEMERKHKQDMEELKLKMDKQKTEFEKEKLLREQLEEK
ncbi:hypothetical protein WMY93_032731 [Mugilogobius chulae]|uniref:AIG1-type G domain-containing protein n=1 Tax=Mugilogobius chulae TaxID=88201 RepID=A0AAW0MM97_9GOBI